MVSTYLCCSYNTDVPLVLMNSFLTDEDTEKIIRKYSSFQVSIKTFRQSCYPRISRDTLMPAPRWPSCTVSTSLSKDSQCPAKDPTPTGAFSLLKASTYPKLILSTRRMP